MSDKRARKTPDNFVSWRKGEKHTSMAIRKQKEEKLNQKAYQKQYSEQKREEKKTMPQEDSAKETKKEETMKVKINGKK
jgi:cytochrome c-type biogenesis protein CcmH/NrfG